MARQLAAVAVPSGRALGCEGTAADWAGNWRSFAIFWGLPSAAMVGAAFVQPGLRGIVWTIMLLWMGGVCLANARRCGRTHCRFTGPFFLLMAGCVAAFTLGVLPLGPNGWVNLSATTLVGFTAIWWLSERHWGPFSR